MNKNPTWYYLRHGQTKHNQKGIIRSLDNVPLDSTGVRSMKKAAQTLKGKGVQRIFSSDIPRALQAAKIVQAELKIPHHVDRRLRTWNLGSLTKAKVSSVRPLLEWYSNHPEKAPQKGEPYGAFAGKLQHFLAEQAARTKGEPDHEIVLIIGHGRHMNLLPRLIKANISGEINTKGVPSVTEDHPGTLQKISFKGNKISRTKLLDGTHSAAAAS